MISGSKGKIKETNKRDRQSERNGYIMKAYRSLAAAALMTLLAVHTVWAAAPGEAPGTGSPVSSVSAGSPVIVVGAGPESSGAPVSGEVSPAGETAPSGEMPSAQLVPEPPQAGAGNPEAVLSPVVIAGQGQTDPAAGQGVSAQMPGDGSGGQEAGTPGAESADPGTGTSGEGTSEQETGIPGQTADQQTGSGRVVDPARPMVALTYDDGPQASVGNRIMDCLAQYGGKATFFMVGERVPSHQAELQRMVSEGHEVANHTMNHKYLQKLGADQIRSQVNQCNDVIEAACGVRPRLMRLPGGNHNATVKASTHMPMIQWSIDTLDWKTRNADQTVNAVLSKVQDGDIILMHELYSQTGDASLRIIPELANRGFQMVTVSEMAAAKGVELQAGQLYSSMR